MDLKAISHVLVPVDLTELSMEALRTALSLVTPDQLHVVLVLPDLHPLDPAVTPDLTPKLRRERAAETLRKELADEGIEGAHRHVAFGDPSWEIVQLAEQLDTQLVIMASHQHTGVRHILLGSVAERVVRRAPCPVLVLRHEA